MNEIKDNDNPDFNFLKNRYNIKYKKWQKIPKDDAVLATVVLTEIQTILATSLTQKKF